MRVVCSWKKGCLNIPPTFNHVQYKCTHVPNTVCNYSLLFSHVLMFIINYFINSCKIQSILVISS